VRSVLLACGALLALTATVLPARAQDGEPPDPAAPRAADTAAPRAADTAASEGFARPQTFEGGERGPAADPEEGTPTPAQPESGSDVWSGFHFGSYGRVVVASDLQGRTGRQARIVTFAPRVDEDDTYAEIELRREDRVLGVDTRIVATVAYGGPLFHYDGEFSERIAIRNLFAETTNILVQGLSIWGGSRMVRGDDVYLMNFWPLDNLNLIGGGLRYALEDDFELALSVGMSQPNNPFQRQTDLFPARAGFLPDEVFVLDRPRTVAAARATYWPFGRFQPDGIKGVLYGEQHFLAAGERRRSDGSLEALPEDSGFVLGAQVGGYITSQRAFANLFFRYARGLGAYDPLGVPFRTGSVIATGRAEEIRIALSANWEWRENPDVGVGVQVGGWWRLFRDADPAVFNRSTISEGAFSVRPMLWFGEHAGVQIDISYQGMQTTALDERTSRPEGGGAFKLGVIPFVTPFGRGTYTRPHIRVHYVLTARDPGARALYNDADPRSRQDLEHFLGISVEWWFSSTSYSP
jgi:maltoporin